MIILMYVLIVIGVGVVSFIALGDFFLAISSAIFKSRAKKGQTYRQKGFKGLSSSNTVVEMVEGPRIFFTQQESIDYKNKEAEMTQL